MEIIQLHNELQAKIYDEHIKLILKWWIPQVLEILSIIKILEMKQLEKQINIKSLIKFIIKNTTKAMIIMSGEYIKEDYDEFIKIHSPTQEAKVPQAVSSEKELENLKTIKSKSEDNKSQIRKLLLDLQQNQIRVAHTDDTSSHSLFSQEDSLKKLTRVSSSDVFAGNVKRTLSYTWSHTSTGDHSPRETGTETFTYEEFVCFFSPPFLSSLLPLSPLLPFHPLLSPPSLFPFSLIPCFPSILPLLYTPLSYYSFFTLLFSFPFALFFPFPHSIWPYLFFPFPHPILNPST